MRLILTCVGAAALALAAAPVLAQTPPPPGPPAADSDHDMPGMDMSGGSMPGMDMGDMKMDGPGMDGMGMGGALGAYDDGRDASGTAWRPGSEPHGGLHGRFGGWMTMLHGYAALILDDQGGRRGATETFVQSHLMAMAQRPLLGGEATLRAGFSLDPLMGPKGYPLLLQTGETADGRTPLVDRQHPHNFFSELSVTYRRPVAEGVHAFVYVADPGEPALGPVTYLHRFAGQANPETPIDHHWLDSTHIAFGVATAGLVAGPVKLEASSFTAREPDQHRWGFNPVRLDSWSARITLNPSPDWSLQASYGDIHSPEQLTPQVNQTRLTASATYNRPMADGNWETTLAFGRDRNRPGRDLDAVLLESAWRRGADTVFGRAEQAQKDELFPAGHPLDGRAFRVGKLSLGYFHTLTAGPHLRLDLGGLVSAFDLPRELDAAYGASPTAVMLFARARI